MGMKDINLKRCLNSKSAALAALAAAAAALFLFAAVPERGFNVSAFSPQGEVSGSVEVVARFSSAVVSGDAVGADLADGDFPVSFSPRLAGAGRWRDASTFVFVPFGGALPPASRFEASVRKDLRDAEGRAFSGNGTFSFSSPALSFNGARQVEFDPDSGRSVFALEFSLPVSPERLRGYADVRDGTGKGLDFYVEGGSASRLALLSLKAPADGKATLSIAKGFPSEAGPLGLPADVKTELKRDLAMAVRNARAESGTGYSRIYIETSAPVDAEKAAAFVEVSPACDFRIEPYGGGFVVEGGFRPQDRVRVTVKKGLPGTYGSPLAEDWSRAFIFPNVEPAVHFAHDGRVLSPKGELRLPVECVNIDKLNIFVWQIYGNNIPLVMGGRLPSGSGLTRLVAEKEYLTRGAPNEPARRALDLKPLLGGARGVFFVNAYNEGGNWDECAVNVTELGLTVKIGPDSALAQVLSLSEAKPVAGAKVTLWSWSNQPVGSGVTGADGLARISLTEGDERGMPSIAVAEKDGDAAFVRMSEGLYGGNEEFDTDGEPRLRSGYGVFCYTPRDIFRPGDEIPVFGVVRGTDGRAPKPFPLVMEVYPPGGKLLERRNVMLSQEGAFSSSVRLSADAPTGVWTFSVGAPSAGSGQRSVFNVYVEDFAAPRLFVRAEASPSYITGDGGCKVSVVSSHSFGGPAAGLKWEAEAELLDKDFTHERWRGFSFRDAEAEFAPRRVSLGSGALDCEGRAEAELKADGWSAPSMLEAAVRVGVMEEGGRWCYETVSVPWYPSGVMVGISAEEPRGPGRPISFRAAAVRPDGSPADTETLKYTLFRRVRRSVVLESGGRTDRRLQEDLVKCAEGDVKLSEGSGSASAVPDRAGEYLLRVETEDGLRRASCYVSIYGGSGGEGSTLPDVADVITDKEFYKAGETAKVRVRSPFPGRALVCAEASGAVWSESRLMKDSEAEFSIPVTEELRPNGWITAYVVRPQEADGSPARACGAAPLSLDCGGSRLRVAFDSQEKLEPGKNRISLRVMDGRGAGRAAHVTVMMTDETVLGLTGYKTPDPWDFFTKRRKMETETFDVYGFLITPEGRSTPLLAVGGGMAAEANGAMMKSHLSPVEARRFRMLCLTAETHSDDDGRCSVVLDVPEFSGEARIMAVAVTASAEGSGETRAQIRRDVVLEPSLPRFAAPGDVFAAPCAVFNMTDSPVKVDVSVSAEGRGASLSLREGARSSSVEIGGGASVTVPFVFEAEGSGVVKAVYKAVWNGGSASWEAEIPVRPAAPRVTKSVSKTLEPGGAWEFVLPGEGMDKPENFAEYSVALSAAPELPAARVASFLAADPYGCFEQTVSAAWPLLAMPDIVRYSYPELADGDDGLGPRISRIAALQRYDGGFPCWDWEWTSRPWESLYGAHFLLEAKRLGHEVPREVLSASVDYARGALLLAPSSDSDAEWSDTLTRRAYAAFVLSLAGEPPLGWIESLRGNIAQMAPSGRLLLACACALAGEKDEASAIVGGASGVRGVAPGNGNYDSELRDKALRLLARTYIDPSGAEAAEAASSLIAALDSSTAVNTQEGGFSMAALGRWAAAQQRSGEPSGRICRLSDGAVKLVGAEYRTEQISGAGLYKVENRGKTPLYASWTASYIPGGKLPEKDDGIEIRQVLTGRDGKPISGEVKRGDLVTAEVTLTPKAGSLRSVAAVMPLPACFESDGAYFGAEGGEGPDGAVVSAREDRIILFADRLDKPIKYHYPLRAVTEGVFSIPQVYAECMYDAGVSSVSGGGSVKVNGSAE